MQCFTPQPATYNPRTKQVRMTPHGAPPQEGITQLTLRCGRCIGCRIERSRQWGIRCHHEAQLHEHNAFVTLTYDDEHFPQDGGISVDELQRFHKRLRHHINPFRHFSCGEYGQETLRPHYHTCLFNIHFTDQTLWKQQDGYNLYESRTLNEIWGLGRCIIGDLNIETAQYTAKYCLKQFGEGGTQYAQLDQQTGEITAIRQPFATMSRSPGIGQAWIEKYHTDIYNKDFIKINNITHRSTKYYDKLYDNMAPEHMATIKQQRIDNRPETTSTELRAREKNTHARIIQRKGY